MTIRTLAEALIKVCDVDTIATLIDCTLSAEIDERLTNAEAEAADMLFGILCDLSPLAMHIAHTGSREGYDETQRTNEAAAEQQAREDAYNAEDFARDYPNGESIQ